MKIEDRHIFHVSTIVVWNARGLVLGLAWFVCAFTRDTCTLCLRWYVRLTFVLPTVSARRISLFFTPPEYLLTYLPLERRLREASPPLRRRAGGQVIGRWTTREPPAPTSGSAVATVWLLGTVRGCMPPPARLFFDRIPTICEHRQIHSNFLATALPFPSRFQNFRK